MVAFVQVFGVAPWEASAHACFAMTMSGTPAFRIALLMIELAVSPRWHGPPVVVGVRAACVGATAVRARTVRPTVTENDST